MAQGKRFYKKNTNGPAGQAPEQNAAKAAGGDRVNTNYENKPNAGQGGRPGKPGPVTANKPGGKPPRKFRKNNWDGNKDRNGVGKGANREGFWKNSWTIFPSCCTISHSDLQCMRMVISSHPHHHIII